METTPATKLPGSHDRIQRLSTTRASSRSSTSTTSDVRLPHLAAVERSPSVMSPTQQAMPLSQHRTPHLVHRFQNSPQATPRLDPNVMDETPSRKHHKPNSKGSDPKLANTAMSTYLQEKLIRERRVENDRSASRMSSNSVALSHDTRGTQSSPARSSHDSIRPRSSNGYLDGVKKNGISLKEMEQTLTTLHKQNFDLKLELYHRREKQATLEERCGSIEAEKRELEDLNDKLMSELEMRDKAVEEAVSMIISLEARMEQLLREREMVQQIEKNNLVAADLTIHRALSSALGNTPFNPPSFDQTPTQKRTGDDARSLNRMPSFVSERSETTENLRNVYLGARGGNSFLSLPDADLREASNRMGSPNLSVLSESSFLSIYGEGFRHGDSPNDPVSAIPAVPARHPSPSGDTDICESAAEPPPDIGLESSDASPAAIIAHVLAATAPTATTNSSRSVASKSSTPTKSRSGSLPKAGHGSVPYPSLTELISASSPLQRLERIDVNSHGHGEDTPHNDTEERTPVSNSPLGRYGPASHASGKPEKRNAIRTVRTDALFSRELSSPSNLPPTPDTISTSTLRRYKNSFDTLSLERGTIDEKDVRTVNDAGCPLSTDLERQSSLDTWDPSNLVMQPPSITAFDSRRNDIALNRDDRLWIPVRPQSADQMTASHQGRSSGWGDSDSSDDDLEIDGNDSASLHDFWLRESLRPNDQGLGRTPKPKSRRPGRVSPDLFRFPSTSNGWATTAMFGTLGGHGYLGAGAAPLAQKMDALGDSLPTPINGTSGISGLLASPIPYGVGGMPSGPPPPPNRRSSLHAQTGSTRELPGFHSSSRNASRHATTAPATPAVLSTRVCVEKRRKPRMRDSSAPALSSNAKPQDSSFEAATPHSRPPQLKEETPIPKQRRYPPTSTSNNSAPRSSRVLSLFRRSGSHEATSPLVAEAPLSASAPATSQGFEGADSHKINSAGSIGVCSQTQHEDLDANGGPSATPPPILRNPRTRTSDGTESCTGRMPPLAREVIKNTTVPAPPLAAGDEPSLTIQHAAATKSQNAQQVTQVQGNAVAEPSGALKTRKKWLSLGRTTRAN